MPADFKSTESAGRWCVVANVKRERPVGIDGELRSGTRQFRGGTKVYIAGCYAGACEGVVAIGLHRHTRRFITCVVHVCHLENFRVRLARHPEVVRRVESDERCWFKTKDDAETWAAAFPKWQAIGTDSQDQSATSSSEERRHPVHRDIDAAELLRRYAAGERRFVGIWLADGSDLRSSALEGMIFEDGGFSDIDVRGANLRGAIFRRSNLKCTDFRSADLTNAIFEDVLVESAAFAGAVVDGCTFTRLHAHSATFDGLRPEEWDW